MKAFTFYTTMNPNQASKIRQLIEIEQEISSLKEKLKKQEEELKNTGNKLFSELYTEGKNVNELVVTRGNKCYGIKIEDNGEVEVEEIYTLPVTNKLFDKLSEKIDDTVKINTIPGRDITYIGNELSLSQKIEQYSGELDFFC